MHALLILVLDSNHRQIFACVSLTLSSDIWQVPGMSPQQLTALNLDKTGLLADILQQSFSSTADDLLGELQFSFLAFLMGHSLEGGSVSACCAVSVPCKLCQQASMTHPPSARVWHPKLVSQCDMSPSSWHVPAMAKPTDELDASACEVCQQLTCCSSCRALDMFFATW